jgi:DNA-binding MarR family transcriptional regulator
MDPVIYRLSTTAPPGEVNLKPESWRILAQVNGERTIAEIAKALGMDEPAAAQIALSLYQAGVLEVAQGAATPARARVDGAFFDEVTHQLATAVGPLAEIVIDEEIENLGESRKQFPRERIPDLVERVSQAIPDEAKRIKFQQVMLEAIRKQ